MWRRSASTACRTTSAASSRARTAAPPGAGSCSATTQTGAVDLSIDRNNPNVIYAALWEAFRKEYTMSSGGPGSGLFKSTDGGETWTEITQNPGMPAGVIGRIGVAVSGADSNRVYALVENENGGLLSSDDAGATWTMVNTNRNIRQRAFYYTHVTADPKNSDTVYLLNVELFKSTDGGKSIPGWGGGTHSDYHDLWIDPDDPQHLVIANDGGGAVSTGGARRRRGPGRAQDFPTAQYYHVDHDEAPAVPRVRRAAGRQHGVRVERAAAGGR